MWPTHWGNLAIQALHICVVSLAESVRIMELVYPIPMRFTDSGKPLWARFSATGGTDMCKGSMAKFALGTEHGQAKLGEETVSIDWRVTNIYRREEGEWNIVHHHTDVSPALVEVLKG